jgi:hypothetical protein
MNTAMKFSGLSAAVIGIATQVPSEFTAFGLTANECQAILVAVGVVYAILGNMFSSTPDNSVHTG